MVIIIVEANIKIAIDITRITSTTEKIITQETQSIVQKLETTDKSLGGSNLFEPLSNNYPDIISKTFPTINPPKVPTI